VVNSPGLQGYFELTQNNQWQPFQAFPAIANLNLRDLNTRLIDLNGDGQPELVVTEEHAFAWYNSKGKRGYEPVEWAAKTFDEERGPAIIFADLQQTIFLADMTGDGLADIVRVRNGEICYWANKGYGHFSAKVAMSNSPRFDHPDSFNPKYLQLADVSGTGTALVTEGLHSPMQIYFAGKSRLINSFAAKGIADQQATRVYEFAKMQYLRILGRLLDFRREINTGTPAAIIPQIYSKQEIQNALGDIPNLELLFGSLDYCDCEHCKSLYSPAAYFTDVLRFIGQHFSLVKKTPPSSLPSKKYYFSGAPISETLNSTAKIRTRRFPTLIWSARF